MIMLVRHGNLIISPPVLISTVHYCILDTLMMIIIIIVKVNHSRSFLSMIIRSVRFTSHHNYYRRRLFKLHTHRYRVMQSIIMKKRRAEMKLQQNLFREIHQLLSKSFDPDLGQKFLMYVFIAYIILTYQHVLYTFVINLNFQLLRHLTGYMGSFRWRTERKISSWTRSLS